MEDNEKLAEELNQTIPEGIVAPEVETVTEELPAEEIPVEDGKEIELSDEEKHAIYIQQLKDSKIKFKPVKHFIIKTTTVLTEDLDVRGKKKKGTNTMILTNVTTNQFGSDYKRVRRRKNKQANASRKANR